MERYELVVRENPFDGGAYAEAVVTEDGNYTLYADAQATVEALQADNRTYINERHENMKQLEELRQQVEALQRERDEANSHVKFLGATKQANGSFCLDMKKYHAGYRCGRHRDDPWQGIDTEIDCFVCLKQALDAERKKVANTEKAYQEKARLWIEQTGALTQLQALVRALPKCEGYVSVIQAATDEWHIYDGIFTTEESAQAYAALLTYRATLGENS